MDWDQVAGVTPEVDERAVEAEVVAYVGGELTPAVPWRIETLGQADWCMRRLAEAQAHEQQYAAEVDRWRKAQGRVSLAAEWFDDRLKEWAIANRSKSVKTFSLAHGSVATRETPAAIEVVDEAAAIEWARSACPSAIRSEERFLVSECKAAARIAEVVLTWEATDKATGELQRIPVEPPVVFDPLVAMEVQAKMEGYAVDAVRALAVVDEAGAVVPGLGVRASRVTATARPVMP